MAMTSAPMPTLPASDIERARAFYTDVLQFTPSEEQLPGGLLFEAGGGRVWVFETPSAGTARNTQAAWFVDDLEGEVRRLEREGVEFQTFDAPGLEWDGVIAHGEGLRSAWFTDSEGNTLCLDERA